MTYELYENFFVSIFTDVKESFVNKSRRAK